MKPTKRSAADTLEVDKNKMLAHQAEETLHSYLRRHLQNVSNKLAVQFPVCKEDLVLDTPHSVEGPRRV